MKRVATGISGFDTLVEGGLIEGDVSLLAGEPGTGKTIFCSQFISNGASKYDQPGVFATFEEDSTSLKRNMMQFGVDLNRLEEANSIRVLDLESMKGEGITGNIDIIMEALDEIDGRRLVVDSLTAFLSACNERFEYRALMHMIYKMLKLRRCTTILTASLPVGAPTLQQGVEQFLADSLIQLESFTDGFEKKTRLIIHKMRGTNHSRKYHSTMITENGCEIIPVGI